MSICSDVGTKYCNMNDAIMTFVIITISCRIIILFPSIAPNVLKKCQQDSNHFAKENHSLSVEGIFKYVRHMSWWIASQVSLTIVEIVVWLMQKLYSRDLKVSPVARYLNITAILSSGLILLCITVSFFSTQQAIWSTRNHYKWVHLLSPTLSQVYYNIHLSFFFFSNPQPSWCRLSFLFQVEKHQNSKSYFPYTNVRHVHNLNFAHICTF